MLGIPVAAPPSESGWWSLHSPGREELWAGSRTCEQERPRLPMAKAGQGGQALHCPHSRRAVSPSVDRDTKLSQEGRVWEQRGASVACAGPRTAISHALCSDYDQCWLSRALQAREPPRAPVQPRRFMAQVGMEEEAEGSSWPRHQPSPHLNEVDYQSHRR